MNTATAFTLNQHIWFVDAVAGFQTGRVVDVFATGATVKIDGKRHRFHIGNDYEWGVV